MGLHRNDVTDDSASFNRKWPIPNTSETLRSWVRQSFLQVQSLTDSLYTFTPFLCLPFSSLLSVLDQQACLNKQAELGGQVPDRSLEVAANGHEDTSQSWHEWKQSLCYSVLFNGLLSHFVWVRLWWVYISLYISYIAFLPSLLKAISSMCFQATNKPKRFRT